MAALVARNSASPTSGPTSSIVWGDHRVKERNVSVPGQETAGVSMRTKRRPVTRHLSSPHSRFAYRILRVLGVSFTSLSILSFILL